MSLAIFGRMKLISHGTMVLINPKKEIVKCIGRYVLLTLVQFDNAQWVIALLRFSNIVNRKKMCKKDEVVRLRFKIDLTLPDDVLGAEEEEGVEEETDWDLGVCRCELMLMCVPFPPLL